MLRDFIVVFLVDVMSTCPRAIPLAMMTTRQQIMGSYQCGASLGNPSVRLSSIMAEATSMVKVYLRKEAALDMS